ncbi:MAG: hypothetical protein DWQ11_09510 [Proteobacteria bacterium]|nr:MAG: hypothetical protein DWQ11_09510 [Pseudomonadota bacterium]
MRIWAPTLTTFAAPRGGEPFLGAARRKGWPHANVREGSAWYRRPVRQARSSASRNPCLTPPRGSRPSLGRPGGEGMAPTLALLAAPRGGCARPWGGPAERGRPPRSLCSLPPEGAAHPWGGPAGGWGVLRQAMSMVHRRGVSIRRRADKRSASAAIVSDGSNGPGSMATPPREGS